MGIFKKRIAFVALLVTCAVSLSRAEEIEIDAAGDDDYQVNQDSEIKDVESVLEKNIPEGAPKVQLPATVKQPRSKVDFTDLKKESHYDDTVVIQKTYMPKTKRFQFFGGFSLAMNDAFFRTMGGQLRAGYHFNETWGLEATGFLLTSQDTNEKKDLEAKQNLEITNLTTPKNFIGLNAYFSSIYGKLALEDRQIVPFEFYQTLGAGQITTNPTSTSTALYFGLGNIFSISKNSAIRADLSWFFYNGKTVNGDTQSANTIFFTIGYGRFVPEVGRR